MIARDHEEEESPAKSSKRNRWSEKLLGGKASALKTLIERE